MSPRISAELSAAQLASVRETGLKVAVVQETLNDWEYITGQSVDIYGHYHPVDGDFQIWDIEYSSYRGFMAVGVLYDGTIIRLRNGDPADLSDRQIWINEVTDPTVLSQWNSWSVLYSGSHYGALGVIPNGTSYDVYHIKSGGFYINNSLVVAAPSGKFINFTTIEGVPGAMWLVAISRDANDHELVSKGYYTPNVEVSPLQLDLANYRWPGWNMDGIKLDDGRIFRMMRNALYHDGRGNIQHQALFCQYQNSIDDITLSPPRAIRGIGGGAGFNLYTGVSLYKLSDGFYYAILAEAYRQSVGVSEPTGPVATNLGYTIHTWMRSKDLENWTEAVIGPPVDNSPTFADILEHPNGYLYWFDNGEVWRRPLATSPGNQTQLEDYIQSISFNLPAGNAEGSGQVVVANPAGVNDWLLDISDERLLIEPGLKVETGAFEFVDFGPFYVKYCTREIDGAVNRITMHFGDCWSKLSQPFKDTINFVGKTDWSDWGPGKRNESFNYYFAADTVPVQNKTLGTLKTTGKCLYTGWKGHNPDFAVQFTGATSTPGLIARYIDSANFIKLSRSGTVLSLVERVGNSDVTVATASVTSGFPFTVRLVLRWNVYLVYVNGVLKMSGNYVWRKNEPGYVGMDGSGYTLKNLALTDWEVDLKLTDLIRAALASGDFHDVTITGAATKAYAIVWGPNTDVVNAADALKQLLESTKLYLAFRGDVLVVDKFTDSSIVHNLQNLIIDSQEDNESRKRINVAIVDGNEFFWIYIDAKKLLETGQQSLARLDLPELLELSAVQARAQEEVTNSYLGNTPSGTIPLLFDLWRMDFVRWIDNAGHDVVVRVEGLGVEINQSRTPFQRMKLDTAVITPDAGIFVPGIPVTPPGPAPIPPVLVPIDEVEYNIGIASAGAVGEPRIVGVRNKPSIDSIVSAAAFGSPTISQGSPPSPVTPVPFAGLAVGGWNVPAIAKTAVDYVTLATPNSGGENNNVAGYLAAGIGVIEVRVGPYGAGVKSINATNWANAALAHWLAHPAILAIEILNEPGGSWFWGSGAEDQVNATAYAVLVKKVHDVFTAAGVRNRVKLLASYDGGHPGGTLWATRVHSADAAIWSYVDGITVHPYGGNSEPARAASALGLRSAVTAAATATSKPVWVTEHGWPTAVGQPPTGDSLQWTESEQADNLYNFMVWATAQSYVGGVIYFSYQDYSTNYWYGVTRIGGAHKKSFEDLRRAAHGLAQS